MRTKRKLKTDFRGKARKPLAILVEPDYKSTFPPIGLMKISKFLKGEGWDTHYVRGRQNLPQRIKERVKEILITSLTTWSYKEVIYCCMYYHKRFPGVRISVGGIMASVMPDMLEDYLEGSVNVHKGLLNVAEGIGVDYELLRNSERSESYIWMSRGCMRRCGFCLVPKIEGDFTPIEPSKWLLGVDDRFSHVQIMDNNWLCKTALEKKSDVAAMRMLVDNERVKSFDFNQALDCRLFLKEGVCGTPADMLKDLPIKPYRFAFDHLDEDGHIQKSIKRALVDSGCAADEWQHPRNTVVVDVLYNYNDTPEDFYYRIKEIARCGAVGVPMRFHPHTDLKRKYVGYYWNENETKAINVLLMPFKSGSVNFVDKEYFEWWWGKNEKEFKRLINIPTGKLRRFVVEKAQKRRAERIRIREGLV
jgi:hypothetical protein